MKSRALNRNLKLKIYKSLIIPVVQVVKTEIFIYYYRSFNPNFLGIFSPRERNEDPDINMITSPEIHSYKAQFLMMSNTVSEGALFKEKF
jgi:hypothetical protein